MTSHTPGALPAAVQAASRRRVTRKGRRHAGSACYYNGFMPIKTKRWNDPAGPDDGRRILICRFRPRGLPKDEESWDEWRKELAPSEALLAAYHGKKGMPIPWSTYRTMYLREMKAQAAAIRELANRAEAGETITLLCSSSCTREARCHRSLLKELIEGALTHDHSE